MANNRKVNDYIGMAQWDDKPRAGRRCLASPGLYKIVRISQYPPEVKHGRTCSTQAHAGRTGDELA